MRDLHQSSESGGIRDETRTTGSASHNSALMSYLGGKMRIHKLAASNRHPSGSTRHDARWMRFDAFHQPLKANGRTHGYR